MQKGKNNRKMGEGRVKKDVSREEGVGAWVFIVRGETRKLGVSGQYSTYVCIALGLLRIVDSNLPILTTATKGLQCTLPTPTLSLPLPDY